MSTAGDAMGPRMPNLAAYAVHDYGDRALLIEFDSTAEVLTWTGALRAADLLGVVDIVPATRTILVRLAGAGYRAPVRQRLSQMQAAARTNAAPPAGRADLTVDVVYDGADLQGVADLAGMTPEQVIAAHTRSPWRVGFSGFAPGFGYLVGGDERLRVPRRTEPRTNVPAGSVGLAGEFSGVYPRRSPGGWQLIGHTELVLFDVHRDPPALLEPGMWVQFRAIA